MTKEKSIQEILDDQKHAAIYKKTTQQIAVTIAGTGAEHSPERRRKNSESNRKFRQENPRTEDEKFACGNNMRGKKLEEILGEDRAIKGKKQRSLATKKQHENGQRVGVGKKMAATRKANGSYENNGMTGKTHKESTKIIQGQKAKIRQELKRNLKLSKNDSVPKDLLLQEYEKHGLI